MKLAWLLVAVASCGDNELGAPATSGTRLALEWYQTDDGARTPDGTIHDRVRDVNCFVQDWTDGTTRCLDAQQGFVGFSDAACTQRVALGDPTQIAVYYDESECGPTSAYQVGAPIAATQWYVQTPTGCAGPYSANQLYAVGATIDPSAFATVDKTALLGDGRLQQIDYAAADGLRLLDQVHDTKLATTCNLQGQICAPDATYSESFTDPACTQRVASIGKLGCSAPLSYYAESDPACSDTTRYYALGPAITVTKLYQLDSSMTCQPTTIDATSEYHSIGAEVTPAMLSTAIADAPGHRLQTIYAAGEGIALPTGLFDTKLGIACAFVMATDGTMRCFPTDPEYGSWFADATCTKTIQIAFTPACRPGPSPTLARGATSGGDDVRIVIGPYTKPIYSGNAQSCTPYQTTGSLLWEIGDLADGSQFVSATTVIDP